MEWTAIPFSPGDLSDPEIESPFPALQADSLPSDLPSEAQESLKDLSGAYRKLALVVKNPLPVEETEETRGWSLDREMPRKRAWQPTPVLLPGESPWTEEPGRLQSIGSRELDRTEVT